ncbi:MAG: hypothetical protein MZV70_28495 [Desulfobacterales bacterium]|nr:hypothetical protein [Desulfobacterales bacterium]
MSSRGRPEGGPPGTTSRQFGLGLADLYIHSITPPPEVQKAIDDKSRLGLFDDLNKLLKMKAAMALESAAQTQGRRAPAWAWGWGS